MSQNSRTPLKLPERIDDDGILVGWSLEHEYRFPPIGFHYGSDKFTPAKGFLNPILFEGEGHLMTIAPTGSGKGTGCIIPTLLQHKGPMIVIDPKGENAAVTARRRRELGQKVVILDPLQVGEEESDRLNPFDLLDRDSPSLPDDVATLINILVPDEVSAKDRFWVSRAQQILIGLTLHLIVDHQPEHRNLATLRKIINQDFSKLEEVAKSMQNSQHPDVRSIASSILVPAPETFGGILSFAQDAVGFLRGDMVQTATSSSTFSFDEITRGDPLTLYLIIPSEKLESHGTLLRLWIGSLIAAIARRQGPPPEPTLFILDEAAQLGPLPQLRQAITLLRGYGLQTWSFWQDVSQLHRLYPADWETMVNNCKVLQAFGANNMNAAGSMSALTGYSRPWEVLDLDYNEMILLIGGDEAVISQRPDYLKDPMFRGMFDENPKHDRDLEPLPAARKPQRVFSRPPKPIRTPSGDPIHPPAPLWSVWERNALGEAIRVRRLEGEVLSKKIVSSLARPKSKNWPHPPILPGDWNELGATDALAALVSVWSRLVPNFGHGLVSIDGVRRLKLLFYADAWLCEARCNDEEGVAGYLTWIAYPNGAVQLTGQAAPIHQLNHLVPFDISEIETAAQYLNFFCVATHAEAGPFRIIENREDLRFPSEAASQQSADAFKKIKPSQLSRPEPDSESSEDLGSIVSEVLWEAECVMQYGDTLFSTQMEIKSNGFVGMLDDIPISEGHLFLIDQFIDGMRVLFAKENREKAPPTKAEK